MPKAIEFQDVSFAYGKTPVLEHASFSVEEGDFLAVIGPNGGGKTTLMRLMLGLLRPTQGTVRCLGETPPLSNANLGYVPQNTLRSASFPITVEDCVRTGLLGAELPFPKSEWRERVQAAIALVELAGESKKRMSELSGGQRQRSLIARALVSAPKILFLDEPAANIDPDGQELLYDILYKLNTGTATCAGMTVVMVSHDLLAVSRRVRSVACVSRSVHYHSGSHLTPEMLTSLYNCPVEFIAHGVPHRVLGKHDHSAGDCCE
jgi:zinc transport system ATP-binding protein